MCVTLVLGLFGACTGDDSDGDETTAGTEPQLADRYELPDDPGFPESLAWRESSEAFYLSALETGSVVKLGIDGVQTVVYTPPEADGFMTLGVKVRPADDSVWVCAVARAGEPDAAAELWVFGGDDQRTVIPLEDGDRAANCNDLAFDGDDVYVTDRESGILWKVPGGKAPAEVLVEDPLLAPELIGQNGVVVVGGALIVGKYSPARLFRIPLADPTALTEVTLGGDALPGLPDGFDGMIQDGEALVIAANADLVELTTTDDWKTATAKVTQPREKIAALTLARGRRYGLKGEVVPWVLGTPVDRPFELFGL